eukprot:jgi/Phyca11/5718/fgenesh1_pm.PHYCAscaffold_7_\
MTEESSTASPRLEPKTIPTLTDKQAIRREQCRANQARYRNKQLNRKRELQEQNQRLEEEIQGLKLKRRSIRFERRTNESPWTIIGEVFRLLEDGFRSPWRLASTEEMLKHTDTRRSLEFLQKSFAHDVAMGELRGINSLMDQWRRYSLYFEGSHLELKRVERVTAGVVSAVATLSVTITDFTVRCNGRINRIEANIDWISPLLRLVGKLKDVSVVLGQALVTSECILGDQPE